jgi:hypothetical protein
VVDLPADPTQPPRQRTMETDAPGPIITLN